MSARLRIAVLLAFAVGASVYIGVRVPLLLEAYRYGAVGEYQAAWRFLVEAGPAISLTFVAAAAPAVLLARDGVRAWWLPTMAFLFLGTAVERWLGYDSVVIRAGGPFLAMVVDLTAALIPAVVLRWTMRPARTRIDRHRVLAGVLALAAFLAWQVPAAVDGDDPGGAAAMVLLLAVLWPIADLRRSAVFVLVGLSASKLGALVVFAGAEATATGLRASLDVVVMIGLGLSVTPLAAAIGRLTRRSMALARA
jgi:hypothetical protein